MGRAFVLFVLALVPGDAGAARLVAHSPPAPLDPLALLTAPLDPLALLSSPGVDPELQPESPQVVDQEVEAILDVEELTERDHVREEEVRHALNCHKFGNNPNFRMMMAQSDLGPEATTTSVDPNVIAVESEEFDEPSTDGYINVASSKFSDRALGHSALGSDMGSTELHKCVLLSYTNNVIKSKEFKNANTNVMENLALPTFPQTLGVFEIDALFHDSGMLAENEFYIVIIEAVAHQAGLATCSLMGDPTGDPPKPRRDDGTMPEDERDYDAAGKVIAKSYRKTWVVHGGAMEKDIELKAELLAAYINDNQNGNEYLKSLAEFIKKDEKHIPFNHKLETAMITFKKCKTIDLEALKCDPEKPSDIKYLHDMAFTTSSAQHPTFDYVNLSSSESQKVKLDSSPGFLFPGWAQGKERAELKGSINWHTTISSEDRGIPAMKQWLYVGVGTDSSVDMDLGVILYRKAPGPDGKYTRHLLNHNNGEHFPNNTKGVKGGRHWNKAVEYSGDSRTGAGEGDDEWMFLDLNMLKVVGVNFIALMVHSYDGTLGKFQDLEGSFARFVMGDANSTDPSVQALTWTGAETVEYIDLDELRGDHPPAVLIGILSLESKSELVLPQKVIDSFTSSVEKTLLGRTEYPGKDGEHYNLAIKKLFSTCERPCQLQGSVCDIEHKVFGMSRAGCMPPSPGLEGKPNFDELDKKPKVKTATHEVREHSLTTVESSELGQPAGAVLDPLGALAPPIDANFQEIAPDTEAGGFKTAETGEHLSGQQVLEEIVDKQTATMGHDALEKELLNEFPGGPPGADTLSTYETDGAEAKAVAEAKAEAEEVRKAEDARPEEEKLKAKGEGSFASEEEELDDDQEVNAVEEAEKAIAECKNDPMAMLEAPDWCCMKVCMKEMADEAGGAVKASCIKKCVKGSQTGA